jgi:hypothetical protein
MFKNFFYKNCYHQIGVCEVEEINIRQSNLVQKLNRIPNGQFSTSANIGGRSFYLFIYTLELSENKIPS